MLAGRREFLAPQYTFWSGALPETDFLARLDDLDELPSTDSRYTTAFQDIVQHRMANDDWDDDWIFHDSRFGLADNDEALLTFLAEMLHPAVRVDLAEVEQVRDYLNSVLVHDGYELVQVDAISGAPIFDYRLIGSGVRGSMKNLIFAAVGPKPEIVLDDAVNNDLRIVRNEQFCLVYDRPLAAHGLTYPVRRVAEEPVDGGLRVSNRAERQPTIVGSRTNKCKKVRLTLARPAQGPPV